ncbi:MAG TPA: hypothetical protein VJO72_10610 [Candidatus Dormibacteraeota bacterium]|nr:hypothetical protein [Candidatus Dormibacteraeota bacterium]
MSYQTAVSGWHDFYLLAGTASATLVGLLFVGLSLHLRIVVTSSEVRSLARVTLANFGAVLFVALFMVIPEGQAAAASQLIGAGIVSLVVALPSLIAVGRPREWTFEMSPMQRVRVALRFGLSAVSYLAIIVAGILLLSSPGSAFTWLLISTVLLLVVSLRNTWDLLVTVADATQGGEGEKD